MASFYDSINDDLKAFIDKQTIFFVATAADKGRINLSPKGMDSLRVLSPTKVAWLNVTGSGNETAAHLLVNDRMTIMLCSFEKKPLILRLYGHAKAFHPRDKDYQELVDLFPDLPGSRQIITLEVDSVQTSCGYAVPMMNLVEERDVLNTWAKNKGPAKIEQYWKDKNVKSIDGLDTKIFG